MQRICYGLSQGKQNEVQSFHCTKCLLRNGHPDQKSIPESDTINRNALSKFFAFSVKYTQAIDFTKVLCYSLSMVPFCLGHPTGTFISDEKSDFKNIIWLWEERFQKYHFTYEPSYTKC